MGYAEQAAVTPNLLREIEQLKEELRNERIAVDYYANRKSWVYPGNDYWNFDIAKKDVEKLQVPNSNSKNNVEHVGGKLARETQEKRKIIL